MIVATKMDGFQEFFLPLTVCSYIDRRILTYRSYRRYIVLFTVTISRFLSLETTFPPPPRYPCCIPRSPTRSLFLVRILFINRDRSVSLFRRRRRRRRAKNVGTFRGKCRRGSLKPDIYRVRLWNSRRGGRTGGQAPPSTPRLWLVRGHKIIDADRCLCAPMTRCPRKIKAVPWPANWRGY